MADASTAAGMVAAAAAGATLSAMPGGEVIVWSLMGGLIAVWISAEESFALTASWLARAAARLCVSAASGVLLSSLALTVGLHMPGFGWLGHAPQWVLAGAAAAVVFKAAPLFSARLTSWLGKGDKYDRGD